MRKTALLLALLLLLSSVLAACGGNDPAAPEAESLPDVSAIASEQEISEEVSEEVSEEPSQEQSAEESEPEEVFTYATVISRGKSYKKSVSAGASYPDTYGCELTDGLFAVAESADYTDEKFVGVDDSFTVDVDLGEVYNKIYGFEVSFLATSEAGIAPPASVRIYVSEDGDNWERQGTCRFPKYEEGTVQKAALTLKRSVSARYVRFDIRRGSHWVFIDEVSVIADIDGGDELLEWEATVNAAYANEALTAAERSAALEKVATGAADHTQEAHNVAKDCKYSYTAKVNSTYPDGGKLTDGESAGYYESGNWVGFECTGDNMDLIVDLGKVRTDVSAFELYAYNNRSVGISFPVVVTFAVSSDKNEWTEIGRVYAPLSGGETHTFQLELENTVRARYVRFTLTDAGSKLFLIEELKVIAYSNDIKEAAMYPEVVLPEVDKNDAWPKDSADYDSTVNLIKGLAQQISCDTELDRSRWSNNTSVTSKLLTDGIYSDNTDIHCGRFFKFYYSGIRDIFYDLGHVSAVSEFKASFTQQSDWAVECPEKIKVMLSEDGKTWYLAGEIVMSYKSDPSIVRASLTLDKEVKARFVCFDFAVNMWSGCDELEVMGKKNATGASPLADAGFSTGSGLFTNSYLAPSGDVLGGVSDIYLAYHGQNVERTVEDLLPVAAYLDAEGNIKDVMFDGFLFLLTGTLPSGNQGHIGYTAKDVDWLINTLYKDGKNVCALEEAAGQVKQALGLPDGYKFKYYVTLYDLWLEDAGDIDGDGVKENQTVFADRLKFTEEVIKRFEKAMSEHPFENIEFCGYYWYDEAMNDAKGDMELLNAISDIVHAHGSQLFWIPYYKAAGYSLWKEHGFDAACMQPNYMFKLETPFSNVRECALLAKRYGMCVEIELCGNALTDQRYRTRYMQYLSSGVTEEYMQDVIHMYYLETLTFVNLYKSQYAPNRLIYDYTYQFIKGTLDITPDPIAPQVCEASAGSAFKGKLAENADNTLLFKVAAAPKHGTVTIESDGSFTYYPDKGYTGEDTFTFRYSEMLEYSEPCTVTINVN